MAAAAVVCALPNRAGAADDKSKKLRVTVIAGGHGFDKKNFPKTFAGHDDIDVKIQAGGKPFEDISKWDRDVMVLYNFKQKISEKSKANFLKLLDRGVGLVVMHHAVAAYPDWPEYEKIIGATYCLKKGVVRNGMKYMRPVWKHDVDFNVRIEDKTHPITKGMSDFKIHDESYRGWVHHPGSHVLLTTGQKLNNHRLAWTRFYGKAKARVFFIQLGHGKHAFQSKDFQTLVAQGIRWAGGKLPAGAGADSRKIVFIGSKGKQPNKASAKLLADCLKTAINAPEIETVVHEGLPADPSALVKGAAAVVICGDADKTAIDALKAAGVGVAMVNSAPSGDGARRVSDCPGHPILRGAKGDASVSVPKSGGRVFGLGGEHSADMWKNEDTRRMMLNGILWAAKIQVPFDGVQTKLPAAGK